MKNKIILSIIFSIIAISGLILILFLFNKQKITYKVSFVSDNGVIIDIQNVSEGSKAIRPVNPEKEGYVFVEWLLNGTRYDFDTEVTQNIELSAKWEIVESDNNTKDDNEEKQEENNNLLLEAPILSKPSSELHSNGMWAQLSIIYEGKYAYSTDGISGYELYEKSGKQYKLIDTSETKFRTEVTVDFGEIKNYVARVYLYNEEKEKKYSEYSNEIIIDNISPISPTLSNPSSAEDSETKWAQLSVVNQGEYAKGTSNISGFELYEKKGDQYKLIYTSEEDFRTEVTVKIGENKTYIAKVYVYNKTKEKIYSDFSNEITI